MEHVVKSEYKEIGFKEEIASNDCDLEYPDDKCTVIEANSEYKPTVNDFLQIKMENKNPFEQYNVVGVPLVNSEYNKIEIKEEISSEIDLKSEYVEDRYTITGEVNEPISMEYDLTPTHLINNQNTDLSEENNTVTVSNAVERLERMGFSQKKSEELTRRISEHWLMHTEKQSLFSEFCPNVDSERNVVKTRQKEKKFSRIVCAGSFPQKRDLGTNKLTHTADQPLSCDICSQEFTRKDNLKRHLLIHTREKYFSCDVCTKTFTQSSLKSHMLIHTGYKPFSCDICTKTFTHRRTLKQHNKIIHTGGRPFSCYVCSKAFTQENQLKTHMLIHIGERSFSCDVCTKTFTHKSILKTHMLIHTGDRSFLCDVCAKTFTQIGSLKTHMLIHTGDRSFSCDVCAKTFTRKGSLKTHMLIHTGYKPFSCDVWYH